MKHIIKLSSQLSLNEGKLVRSLINQPLVHWLGSNAEIQWYSSYCSYAAQVIYNNSPQPPWSVCIFNLTNIHSFILFAIKEEIICTIYATCQHCRKINPWIFMSWITLWFHTPGGQCTWKMADIIYFPISVSFLKKNSLQLGQKRAINNYQEYYI